MIGSCSLAFSIHNLMNPVIHLAKYPKKNERNLKIVFLIGFLVYSLIGILGYIATLNLKCNV